MLFLTRRGKIRLIKKLCPDYQVESLRFSDYKTWQDDDLLDDILIELIEALPNDQ